MFGCTEVVVKKYNLGCIVYLLVRVAHILISTWISCSGIKLYLILFLVIGHQIVVPYAPFR